MRRISSELSPCRRVEMSRVSLRDLQRYQGCWRLCQEGIWKGLLPGCQVWLHPLLPHQPGYWYESLVARPVTLMTSPTSTDSGT